jgi:hypothetical protein
MTDESSAISLSSQCTVYSGFARSLTCDCGCDHFREYLRPQSRSKYKPGLSLCADQELIEDDEECIVCKSSDQTSLKVFNLNCGCVFHRKCIKKYLLRNPTTKVCPHELPCMTYPPAWLISFPFSMNTPTIIRESVLVRGAVAKPKEGRVVDSALVSINRVAGITIQRLRSKWIDAGGFSASGFRNGGEGLPTGTKQRLWSESG